MVSWPVVFSILCVVAVLCIAAFVLPKVLGMSYPDEGRRSGPPTMPPDNHDAPGQPVAARDVIWMLALVCVVAFIGGVICEVAW